MIANQIRGKRFHFAGSASEDCKQENLRYAHEIIGSLAANVTTEGGGLVVTIGGEPRHQTGERSSIFDWTILDSFSSRFESGATWPFDPGSQLVAVGFHNWRDRVPEDRRPKLRQIAATGKMELVPLKSGLNVGGLLRQVQSSYGDVLVTMGGGPGTQHLAQLYCDASKPVIPLDLDLGSAKEKKRASRILSSEAGRTPQRFFGASGQGLSAMYSTLSFSDGHIPLEQFRNRFFGFFAGLPPPLVFFVRLQNKDHQDSADVEWFFRNVVDKVVSKLDFRKFETGVEATSEPFLNVEIFNQIAKSTLVIADVTGLRPNCFMEIGYAYGNSKKVILTSRESTKLPFDSASLPCFFWSTKGNIPNLIRSFTEFISRNIGRGPLIGIQEFK